MPNPKFDPRLVEPAVESVKDKEHKYPFFEAAKRALIDEALGGEIKREATVRATTDNFSVVDAVSRKLGGK